MEIRHRSVHANGIRPTKIVKRQVSLFYRADPDYWVGVATRMGLAEDDLSRGPPSETIIRRCNYDRSPACFVEAGKENVSRISPVQEGVQQEASMPGIHHVTAIAGDPDANSSRENSKLASDGTRKVFQEFV